MDSNITGVATGYRVISELLLKPDAEFFDYLICWCIDASRFYIIPRKFLGAKSTVSISLNPESKYNPYFEAWDLLK